MTSYGCGRRDVLKAAGLGAASLAMGKLSRAVPAGGGGKGKPPNIVYILADDLGYGDVSHLNPQSKIKTPNIDRLAAEGITFTDAHAPDAVCTPTRYGVLTGRYCWRTRLKKGVLWGYSPPLVEKDRMTVASLLKSRGYYTACVGKWHLGVDWKTTDAKPPSHAIFAKNVDYTAPVRGGPTDVGFDYFFGIAASLDMPPYVYIENDRPVEKPVARWEKSDSKHGYLRTGPAMEGVKPEDVLPDLTEKSVDIIAQHAKNRGDKPLFLYFPLTAPHTPIAPAEKFSGASKAGDYGDFVAQVDWTVGRVADALDKAGLDRNTLLIVTSDNGPEFFMHKRKEKYGHYSAYHFRGCKRDNWEGGHRMPLVARWPGRIKPGGKSGELVSLTDLLATAADVVGAEMPGDAGEDSISMLPVMLGDESALPAREAMVHHSSNGRFAVRRGRWKLLLHPGSGGNKYASGPNAVKPGDPKIQLYDMSTDPQERHNLQDEHPEIVAELTELLGQYRKSGRSRTRPGRE